MFHLPPLHPRDPHESHRSATQLELFFDLVAVIAIAALTAAFHHAVSAGHGHDMLPNFLFLFVAIWWSWMNHAWYASAFDNDDAVFRVLTLVVMCGFLLFAAGVQSIFDSLDFKFGLLGWVIMRLGMIALWLRAARHSKAHRETAKRYALGIFVAQLLWCLLYLFVPPGGSAFILTGIVIFACEFAVPAFAESHRATPWHRHHMIERYGLLNIIILGEVLLSISFMLAHLYAEGFSLALVSKSLAAMLVVFAMWWIYFLESEHLAASNLSTALIWGYGHIFVFLGGALLAVGIGAQFDVISHHSQVTMAVASHYADTAIALYLAGLWLVRDRLVTGGFVTLLGAIAFALVARLGIGLELAALLCLVVLGLRIALGRGNDGA